MFLSSFLVNFILAFTMGLDVIRILPTWIYSSVTRTSPSHSYRRRRRIVLVVLRPIPNVREHQFQQMIFGLQPRLWNLGSR